MYIGFYATLAKSSSSGLDIDYGKKLPLKIHGVIHFAYSKCMHGNTSVMGINM